MPIVEERVGRIFDQTEHTTVIAAVNNELQDDRDWTSDLVLPTELSPGNETLLGYGTVVTVTHKTREHLVHLVVCHDLKENGDGWEKAPAAIRYALNNLARHYKDEIIAIVAIGTGPTGRNQGARWTDIRNAIHDESVLNVVLYWESDEQKAMIEADPDPKKVISAKEELPVSANDEGDTTVNNDADATLAGAVTV